MIIGGTLPPFEVALPDTPLDNHHHAANDAQRQTVSYWIRESDAFDAIVDFDAVLRDPNLPTRLIPRIRFQRPLASRRPRANVQWPRP